MFHKTISIGADDGFSDYLVTDIHGQWSFVLEMLNELGFKWPIGDNVRDRLYVIGDAIDRGPESLEALTACLYNPAITFIKGNHEMLGYLAFKSNTNISFMEWAASEGDWHLRYDRFYVKSLFEQLDSIPSMVTLNVGDKSFGLVHGGIPTRFHAWSQVISTYNLIDDEKAKLNLEIELLEDRTASKSGERIISDVDAVISGHVLLYPSIEPKINGNQVHIDAGISIGTRGLILKVEEGGNILGMLQSYAFKKESGSELKWL